MTNVIMYVSLYNDDDSDMIKQNLSSSEWLTKNYDVVQPTYAEQHDLTVCHLCNSKTVIRPKSGTNVIIESQDLIQ